MATTHYSGLKMYAANEPGVLNASVEFDEKTLRPTYRLLVGLAGSSSGLEIARRFGIPNQLIESAATQVKQSSLEAIAYLRRIKDEAEEALRVAHALGDRLYGIRLDTPSERGRVTADLVHEVRERLDQAGFQHVKIVVSGGMTPERIGYFKEAAAPVDSYAVGSYISGASPIDFTGDIKVIDGAPIAKRGRIPGLTESPRLKPVDLAPWREALTG